MRRALPHDPKRIRAARFSQSGILRTSGYSRRWMRFTAVQTVTPPAREFVWDARVRIAPLLHLRVNDSLKGGRGAGRVELLKIKLAEDAGTPEIDSGALHRYLAEAVWYPSALLPDEDLRWSLVDDHKAVATLTSHGTTVSLEFRFTSAGEVAAIYTPSRWGRFDGAYREAAWEGHFAEYQVRSGMLIPGYGEVGWYLDGRWEAVWKGRVIEASYETAP